jgi:hypothetical protein
MDDTILNSNGIFEYTMIINNMASPAKPLKQETNNYSNDKKKKLLFLPIRTTL